MKSLQQLFTRVSKCNYVSALGIGPVWSWFLSKYIKFLEWLEQLASSKTNELWNEGRIVANSLSERRPKRDRSDKTCVEHFFSLSFVQSFVRRVEYFGIILFHFPWPAISQNYDRRKCENFKRNSGSQATKQEEEAKKLTWLTSKSALRTYEARNSYILYISVSVEKKFCQRARHAITV